MTLLVALACAVLLGVPGSVPPAVLDVRSDASRAGSRVDSPRWLWPVGGTGGPAARPIVLRGFDPPAQRWLPGHRGVDLLADPGAEVRAAGDGVVAFAGRVAGRGVVSIQHGSVRTTYEPVSPAVVAGDRVRRGQPIGVLEPRSGVGHCPVDCLHWGLRRGETYLDPLALVRPRPRLLPWLVATGPARPRATVLA